MAALLTSQRRSPSLRVHGRSGFAASWRRPAFLLVETENFLFALCSPSRTRQTWVPKVSFVIIQEVKC